MGKAWKLQLFQYFCRSRPKQRKTLNIAEKISHVPFAFISDMLKIRRKPGNYNFFIIFGRSCECCEIYTHTNSWHAILMLSCFIAKNSTQSDGRFRRLPRYSMFICHLFFVAYLCHQFVTLYIYIYIHIYIYIYLYIDM